MANQQIKNEIDAVFKDFDKDNSGTLDIAEVKQFFAAVFANAPADLKKPTDKDIENFAYVVDKNGDGKINKQELYQFVERFSQ